MVPRNNARICFLSQSGELGGAETCLVETLEVLRERHPEWHLLLIVPDEGPLAAHARRLDSDVEVMPFPAAFARLGDSNLGHGARSGKTIRFAFSAAAGMPGLAKYSLGLRRRLQSYAPDLVYANGFKPQIVAALALPRSMRLVWHTHDYVSSRPIVARLYRRYWRRCARFLANSRDVAADLRSVIGPRKDLPFDVIYNAVDSSRFSPMGPRLDLDGLSGLEPAPSGCVRVGLVATMAWWKGHRTYLEAISRLRDSQIRAYVVGGPIYRTSGSESSLDELREQVRRLGIGERVGFTGFVADTASAIRSLDIVVHASTRPEPFGRALIEAMACGKPVITTGLGGSAEIISAGEGTLKCWPGEADDLAATIARLAADPALRKFLGDSARKTVVENFSREQLAENLERLWNQFSVGNRSVSVEPARPLEENALASGI